MAYFFGQSPFLIGRVCKFYFFISSSFCKKKIKLLHFVFLPAVISLWGGFCCCSWWSCSLFHLLFTPESSVQAFPLHSSYWQLSGKELRDKVFVMKLSTKETFILARSKGIITIGHCSERAWKYFNYSELLLCWCSF